MTVRLPFGNVGTGKGMEFVSRSRHRKGHAKSTPLTRRAFHCDIPAMLLNNLLDDSQSQSDSTALFPFRKLGKPVKYFWQIFFFDAASAVNTLEIKPSSMFVHLQGNSSALIRVSDCISDKVRDDPWKSKRINGNGR